MWWMMSLTRVAAQPRAFVTPGRGTVAHSSRAALASTWQRPCRPFHFHDVLAKKLASDDVASTTAGTDEPSEQGDDEEEELDLSLPDEEEDLVEVTHDPATLNMLTPATFSKGSDVAKTIELYQQQCQDQVKAKTESLNSWMMKHPKKKASAHCAVSAGTTELETTLAGHKVAKPNASAHEAWMYAARKNSPTASHTGVPAQGLAAFFTSPSTTCSFLLVPFSSLLTRGQDPTEIMTFLNGEVGSGEVIPEECKLLRLEPGMVGYVPPGWFTLPVYLSTRKKSMDWCHVWHWSMWSPALYAGLDSRVVAAIGGWNKKTDGV